LRSGPTLMSRCACTSEEDAGDTGEGGGELAEASKGTCRYRCGNRFLLTSTRCKGRLDQNSTWGGRHSSRRRTGGRRGIRSPQSRPWCHLYHLREIRSSFTTVRSKYLPDEPVCRKQLPSGKRFKTSAHALLRWRRFSECPRMMRQRRSAGMCCYGMPLFPFQARSSTFSSKFEDIEGQLRSLSEKPRLQRFADHAQDDEEVSGLIEDLREAISDYQVRLSPRHHSRCLQKSRWCNKWQSTTN